MAFYSPERLVYHQEMRSYPILLQLADKRCLVVGAGRVGARKIAGLLDGGVAEVLALDPGEPAPELEALRDRPELRFERRAFVEADLDGRFLVFASTSNPELNARVAALCRERGLLCNVADQPAAGSFVVPASVRRGDLLLTVSTGGHSPALSRAVRRKLETHFGPEYGLLLALLGRIRLLLLDLGAPTDENTTIFRALVASDLLHLLETKDADALRERLAALLPRALHPNIAELLDGIL